MNEEGGEAFPYLSYSLYKLLPRAASAAPLVKYR